MKLDVYVDCIEDASSNNEAVTPATAAHLRNVMDRCATLIYAVSVNAASSKWMPWELGYSDACHGKVLVLPITDAAATMTAYQRQEFVGLYPYVEIDTQSGTDKKYLWVYDPSNRKVYERLDVWYKTGKLVNHG